MQGQRLEQPAVQFLSSVQYQQRKWAQVWGLQIQPKLQGRGFRPRLNGAEQSGLAEPWPAQVQQWVQR